MVESRSACSSFSYHHKLSGKGHREPVLSAIPVERYVRRMACVQNFSGI